MPLWDQSQILQVDGFSCEALKLMLPARQYIENPSTKQKQQSHM